MVLFSLLPLLLQQNDCCSVMCTNFVYDSIEQRACKFIKRFGLFVFNRSPIFHIKIYS